MIKAIIFDMDGVLIDARDWHYEALNAALEMFGYVIPRVDHLTSFDGLPTKDKLKKFSQAYGLPVGLHDLINAVKQKHTVRIMYERCGPTFNHQVALSKLRRDGLRIAVASNSIRQTVEAMMKLSDLERYLEFFLSNEEVTKGKPDPEIYNLAISTLSLLPEECVIVEDNPNGLKAAIASGAHVLQVADPSHVSYEMIRSYIEQVEG